MQTNKRIQFRDFANSRCFIRQFRRGFIATCMVVVTLLFGNERAANAQQMSDWKDDQCQQVQFLQQHHVRGHCQCERCQSQYYGCQEPCYQDTFPVQPDYETLPVAPEADQTIVPDSTIQVAPPASGSDLDLGFYGSAGLGSSTVLSETMYVDDAAIARQFRFRFDGAFNNPLPDRAEFFYGQCGCFNRSQNPPVPPAPGPPLAETSVDYQEYSMYLELAPREKFSSFFELPFRAINPDVNENHAGLSDIVTGFKLGLITRQDRLLTFQLKTYIPSGDANAGLGTGHVSLEPGILYFRRLNNRLTVNAELRDWIPLSANNVDGQLFAGNVIRYGFSSAYDLFQMPVCGNTACAGCGRNLHRLSAVTEIVGWSVLDGLAFDGNTGRLLDADGTDILNIKFGLRYSVNGKSLAISYGRTLSDDTWYSDIARLEYRIAF